MDLATIVFFFEFYAISTQEITQLYNAAATADCKADALPVERNIMITVREYIMTCDEPGRICEVWFPWGPEYEIHIQKWNKIYEDFMRYSKELAAQKAAKTQTQA